MSVSAFRNGSSNMAQAVHRGVALANEPRNHIQLKGLPRTVLPSDIQRVCQRNQIVGVTSVDIDYHRFIPTGRAVITLANSTHLNANLKNFQKATVSSLPIEALSINRPSNSVPKRSRGQEGRQESAQRGIMTGNGPRAGCTTAGKNVVIWGLPGKLTPQALRMFLQHYKLGATDGGKQEFIKIDPPQFKGAYTRFSKHLVRMSSEAEAHRLVRAMHMTYFEPDVHKQKYPIRAQVIY